MSLFEVYMRLHKLPYFNMPNLLYTYVILWYMRANVCLWVQSPGSVQCSAVQCCVLYYYLWPAHQTILMSFMRTPFYYLFLKSWVVVQWDTPYFCAVTKTLKLLTKICDCNFSRWKETSCLFLKCKLACLKGLRGKLLRLNNAEECKGSWNC